MAIIRLVSNKDECEKLWNDTVPRETIWDLWEVRKCFDTHFNIPSLFVTAEEDDRITGLLPLSWIEENDCYVSFPGETWSGKTWIEQNRIPAREDRMRDLLLESCPAPYQLRYVRETDSTGAPDCAVDEVGYLFHPARYGFDMDNYFQEFSGKSLKRLKKALADWEARSVSYRYDHLGDFETLVSFNLSRYEDRSYFHDIKFRESIRSLMHLLNDRGWLRITTVLIDGRPAAVDLGSVFNNTYTLIAGGTDSDFPGIAKLINIHHMQWACSRRILEVDFLCGDFSWKPMFHLTPRPLYMISNLDTAKPRQQQGVKESTYVG
jgi:hypothetical protein